MALNRDLGAGSPADAPFLVCLAEGDVGLEVNLFNVKFHGTGQKKMGEGLFI